MKVILDNGHGEDTKGKRSPVWDDGRQLFEYEFNRDIVLRIYDRLTQKGYNCKLLVPEKRDVPLRERVDRINEIWANDPECFVISVHANAGGGSGWEAYTYYGKTESDRLATLFYQVAREKLKDFPIRADSYSDGDPDKEAAFYILKKSYCPAVLTENLFMDTKDDCQFIMSDLGREVISELHEEAIIRYITEKEKTDEGV